ncbi:hypothetical protein ACFLZV_07500, partial [Candidatus Margulisiibacteriota bacterium]
MENKKIVSVKRFVSKKERLMLKLYNGYYDLNENQLRRGFGALTEAERDKIFKRLIDKFDLDRIKFHSQPEDIYKNIKAPWYRCVLAEYLKFFLFPKGKDCYDVGRYTLSRKLKIDYELLKKTNITSNFKIIKIQDLENVN